MAIDVSFYREKIILYGKMHAALGNKSIATIILLHGSPGNETDVLGLGEKLAEKRYNVLTFNYSDTYRSEGLFSFANTQLDIHAAFQYLHQSEQVQRFKIDTSRLYIGGWSYGGGMALNYAANNPKVKATFSIAGTDHGEFFREYSRDSGYQNMVDEMFETFKNPESPMRLAIGATPKEIYEQSLDMTPYDLSLSAQALATKQLLLIGGWDDLNIKIEKHILPLYRALKREKAQSVTIHILPDDHAFSKVRSELVETIFNWVEKEAL